jgi:pimeloyl-ACP methyl ester carboxylesterase
MSLLCEAPALAATITDSLDPGATADLDALAALPQIPPPSAWLLLAELRAFPEFGAYLASRRLLRRAPRGDGHPVMVLPGLGGGDGSTRPLRSFLRHLGYTAHPWRQGTNVADPQLLEPLVARLRTLHERRGRAVSLIGWSLGGVYAREAAKEVPHAVRQVITLGSPFTGHPYAANGQRLYRLLTGKTPSVHPRWFDFQQPPPAPTTSIYSRTDGIVHWRCSLNEPGARAENIQVRASHCGLGHHPVVLYAIADRLAQPEGQWQPFQPGRLQRLLFPRPDRP